MPDCKFVLSGVGNGFLYKLYKNFTRILHEYDSGSPQKGIK